MRLGASACNAQMLLPRGVVARLPGGGRRVLPSCGSSRARPLALVPTQMLPSGSSASAVTKLSGRLSPRSGFCS